MESPTLIVSFNNKRFLKFDLDTSKALHLIDFEEVTTDDVVFQKLQSNESVYVVAKHNKNPQNYQYNGKNVKIVYAYGRLETHTDGNLCHWYKLTQDANRRLREFLDEINQT